MNTQKTVLLQQLQQSGWRVAVIGNDDDEFYALDWWADEAWRLTSLWSPRGLKVYLVFMVNPLADIYKCKQGESWEVKASLTLPTQRYGQEGEIAFDLTGGWRDRLQQFIADTSALRSSKKITD